MSALGIAVVLTYSITAELKNASLMPLKLAIDLLEKIRKLQYIKISARTQRVCIF